MKKYLGWAAIAFILFFLFTNPTGAATIVTNVVHSLGTAASSLSTFVTSL